MIYLLYTIHIIVCLFLMLVILLQAGKGGGVGAGLGGATTQQVFGGRGASNFLERLTTATAIVFMLTAMTLSYINSQSESAKLQKTAAARKKKAEADAKKKAEDALKGEIEKKAKEAAQKALTFIAHHAIESLFKLDVSIAMSRPICKCLLWRAMLLIQS